MERGFEKISFEEFKKSTERRQDLSGSPSLYSIFIFSFYYVLLNECWSHFLQLNIVLIEKGKKDGGFPTINLPGFLREAEGITNSVTERSDELPVYTTDFILITRHRSSFSI